MDFQVLTSSVNVKSKEIQERTIATWAKPAWRHWKHGKVHNLPSCAHDCIQCVYTYSFLDPYAICVHQTFESTFCVWHRCIWDTCASLFYNYSRSWQLLPRNGTSCLKHGGVFPGNHRLFAKDAICWIWCFMTRTLGVGSLVRNMIWWLYGLPKMIPKVHFIQLLHVTHVHPFFKCNFQTEFNFNFVTGRILHFHSLFDRIPRVESPWVRCFGFSKKILLDCWPATTSVVFLKQQNRQACNDATYISSTVKLCNYPGNDRG